MELFGFSHDAGDAGIGGALLPVLPSMNKEERSEESRRKTPMDQVCHVLRLRPCNCVG